MSTIVVVCKNGQACIAADSLTTFGGTRQSSSYDRHPDKILTLEQGYVGIVGSAAHQMVLESALEELADKVDFSSRRGIFETFRQLHPLLKDHYFLNPKDEDEDEYESTRIDAFILNEYGVFGVYALREVFEYSHYWALGSGAEFALGAMHALYPRGSEDARSIATAGVAAGAEFDTSSALPLTLYNVTLSAPSPRLLQV